MLGHGSHGNLMRRNCLTILSVGIRYEGKEVLDPTPQWIVERADGICGVHEVSTALASGYELVNVSACRASISGVQLHGIKRC